MSPRRPSPGAGSARVTWLCCRSPSSDPAGKEGRARAREGAVRRGAPGRRGGGCGASPALAPSLPPAGRRPTATVAPCRPPCPLVSAPALAAAARPPHPAPPGAGESGSQGPASRRDALTVLLAPHRAHPGDPETRAGRRWARLRGCPGMTRWPLPSPPFLSLRFGDLPGERPELGSGKRRPSGGTCRAQARRRAHGSETSTLLCPAGQDRAREDVPEPGAGREPQPGRLRRLGLLPARSGHRLLDVRVAGARPLHAVLPAPVRAGPTAPRARRAPLLGATRPLGFVGLRPRQPSPARGHRLLVPAQHPGTRQRQQRPGRGPRRLPRRAAASGTVRGPAWAAHGHLVFHHLPGLREPRRGPLLDRRAFRWQRPAQPTGPPGRSPSPQAHLGPHPAALACAAPTATRPTPPCGGGARRGSPCATPVAST
ncbi:transcription factor GATA-5 isoform X4 [Callithrix jacchus]